MLCAPISRYTGNPFSLDVHDAIVAVVTRQEEQSGDVMPVMVLMLEDPRETVLQREDAVIHTALSPATTRRQ